MATRTCADLAFRGTSHAECSLTCLTERFISYNLASSRLSDMRAGSTVSGCFLRELYTGAESELGVDMGEVGLHGPR